jgi:hypothetical protein
MSCLARTDGGLRHGIRICDVFMLLRVQVHDMQVQYSLGIAETSINKRGFIKPSIWCGTVGWPFGRVSTDTTSRDLTISVLIDGNLGNVEN